ncbi:TetR/AcrR family transcriptional regulator [Frondihabitans australicus]|uniref:TetR family transcriptional regulator n=1 Tax=Frondihabitans australicus TaxID=386892 RepID=A0A495IKJ0_9MICO|nr:helix-turn-helix domain-containing protein [Frondihabitans australicus]RKR75948.1 TetR family transcriptional regulator [Frondihabitans australicus]
MTTELAHLRSDARDNRDRIVEAARALFAERGLDVGMREIARRAEVGPATLYRRFATRDDLVDEAFSIELETCRRIVVEGCADDDAWRGLSSTLTALVELNAGNRGFVDAFTATAAASGSAHSVIAAHRRELLGMLAGLVARARAAGRLRADFTVDDVVLILRAGRGAAAGGSVAAARRFVELTLDGLRSRGAD